MPIGLIARVKIAPGKGGEFEELFAWQAEQVRANEPGNSLYRLFRSPDQDGGEDALVDVSTSARSSRSRVPCSSAHVRK